jgi:hypothetical protein
MTVRYATNGDRKLDKVFHQGLRRQRTETGRDIAGAAAARFGCERGTA